MRGKVVKFGPDGAVLDPMVHKLAKQADSNAKTKNILTINI